MFGLRNVQKGFDYVLPVNFGEKPCSNGSYDNGFIGILTLWTNGPSRQEGLSVLRACWNLDCLLPNHTHSSAKHRKFTPFSFFFCLIGLLWVTYYLHFSVFSLSLSAACSNTHLLVLCLCLLPVALRRALLLMYLRPPQPAVFTRPLQGSNGRRMTWSMFPAEQSTAISLLQLPQPFFIMSCLCSSRYR